VYGMLQFIDNVGQIPATSRTTNTRVWGPIYPIDSQPGFEGQIVMARTPPLNYDWEIDFRPHLQGGNAWFSFVKGSFAATGGARRGSGAFGLDAAGARAVGLATPGMETLLTLDTNYATDAVPISVNIVAVGATDAGTGTLRYDYHGYPPDAGDDGGISAAALQYQMVLDPLDGGAPLSFQVHSAWLSDGSGRGDSRVTQGPLMGFVDVECWGPRNDFFTTFIDQTWTGGLVAGDAGTCRDVSGL